MFIKTATDFVSATLSVGLVVAISTFPVAAVAEQQSNNRTQTVSGFNWMANGNTVDKRAARARKAARRASLMSTRGGATWICSPAGFGQPSRCHRS